MLVNADGTKNIAEVCKKLDMQDGLYQYGLCI